jgi:hypothetical protein
LLFDDQDWIVGLDEAAHPLQCVPVLVCHHSEDSVIAEVLLCGGNQNAAVPVDLAVWPAIHRVDQVVGIGPADLGPQRVSRIERHRARDRPKRPTEGGVVVDFPELLNVVDSLFGQQVAGTSRTALGARHWRGGIGTNSAGAVGDREPRDTKWVAQRSYCAAVVHISTTADQGYRRDHRAQRWCAPPTQHRHSLHLLFAEPRRHAPIRPWLIDRSGTADVLVHPTARNSSPPSQP